MFKMPVCDTCCFHFKSICLRLCIASELDTSQGSLG